MVMFNNEGPQCPHCGHIQTPDEPFYFDESTTKLDCGECEKEFSVRVYIDTSWETRKIE